jgi:hypothetical protein
LGTELLFKQRKVAFTQSKGIMKHECVNKPFSQKKERWMPNLRQQTRRSAVWADLTKQLYKQFPKRTVICTSSLQVLCHLQVNLQVS